MARRSTSRSSRSSRAPAAPRVDADGKVGIFCPNCGTRYRLDEMALDTKVRCTECTHTFLPRNTVGKVAQGKDHTKVYVTFGVLVVVLVAGIALLMNKRAQEPVESALPKAAAAPDPAKVLEIERKRRLDQLVKWAQAAGNGEIYTVRTYGDLPGLCALLGVNPRLPKDQLDAELQRALKTNTNTRVLAEFACSSGTLDDASARNPSGSARLQLKPKPGDDNYDRLAEGELQVDFKMDSDTVRVTGCKVTNLPKRRAGR